MPHAAYRLSRHPFRLILSAALGIALLTAQGCAGPSGSAQLYNPKSDALGRVFPDKLDMSKAVMKTDPNRDLKGKDVFALYLSDAYFKYLPDFSGSNEVVIVAEFTEVSAGDKGDTVTTVLGPYTGVGDPSKAPFFNKLLYGPKKLEADQISVTLTVLEYDQGENEDTAAFLDFINSVGQTLSLDNPVTAAERTFTKEIAKSLLSLNKDDVVMRVSFDLLGNAGNLQDFQDVNGSAIPLNPGNYILINQESCALTTCFGYLSKNGTSRNPVAYIGDAVMSVPVAIKRGLTDAPDGPSLADIDPGQIKLQQQTLTGTNGKPYTDKTWLSLSVVQGGDPSLWAKRKLLLNAEEMVQRIAKSRTGGLQVSQNYQAAIESLEAARRQEKAASGVMGFANSLNTQGEMVFATSQREICLQHPGTLKSDDITAQVFKVQADKSLKRVADADIAIDPSRSTPNNTCLKTTANGMSTGRYRVELTYAADGETYRQRLDYEVK